MQSTQSSYIPLRCASARVVALAILCLFANQPVMAQNAPSDAEIEAFAAELADHAGVYTDQQGFDLRRGNYDEIRRAIVKTLKQERQPLDGRSLERGKREIERFIDRMIVISVQLGPERVLGERSLAGALSSLCPIWPICRG